MRISNQKALISGSTADRFTELKLPVLAYDVGP